MSRFFLDFASTRETRKFNSYLELIYSIISYSAITANEQERREKNHWIYYHYLGGIGESLFAKDGNEALLRCLTFHEFCLKYKEHPEGDFCAWINEVEKLFANLSAAEDDLRWKRLQMLWLCLDELLEFADPKSLRTTRKRVESKNIADALREKVISQAKWYRLNVR